MDTNTTILIVTVILALIALVSFFMFRQRNRVNLRGPFGTGVEVEGSNDPAPPAPGIKAQGIKSRQGGLKAYEETGRGMDVQDVEVEKNVDLRSSDQTPDKTSGQAPKAPPPA